MLWSLSIPFSASVHMIPSPPKCLGTLWPSAKCHHCSLIKLARARIDQDHDDAKDIGRVESLRQRNLISWRPVRARSDDALQVKVTTKI